MTATILQFDNVELSFAGVKALNGVSLAVQEGSLHAVIGPNGAGKTSMFNCVSGSYRPQAGSIHFAGQSLIGRQPDEIARLGISRMFQNLLLFEHMTVLDNLMLGRTHLYKTHFVHDLFRTPTMRRHEVEHRRSVEEIIEFLALEQYRMMPISILPYGILKRVELGRALAMAPKLLLLDEPAAGLNQEETEDMARFIMDIKDVLGVTQILIEHDLRFIFDLADRVTVLDFGQTLDEGTPRHIKRSETVKRAYMGQAMDSGGRDHG